MFRFALLLIVLLPALSACDSAEQEAGFRLNPGDVRLYAFESTFTDTAGVVQIFFADTIRASVVDNDRSVEGLDGLTEVEYVSLISGAESRTWYREEDMRIVEVAYQQPALPITAQLRIDPDIATHSVGFLAGLVADSGGEDIEVRADPRIVLSYPLEVGRSWVSLTEPFFSERSVEREETLQIGLGSFETVVIRTTIDFLGEDYNWLDWLDEGGLIKRSISFLSEIRDVEGNVISEGVQEEVATLIENG